MSEPMKDIDHADGFGGEPHCLLNLPNYKCVHSKLSQYSFFFSLSIIFYCDEKCFLLTFYIVFSLLFCCACL